VYLRGFTLRARVMFGCPYYSIPSGPCFEGLEGNSFTIKHPNGRSFHMVLLLSVPVLQEEVSNDL